MAEQLSQKIKESLNRYYVNRKNQSVMDYSGGVLKERWNKAEDLDVIFKVAREEGWSSQACAGQFWFSKKTILGTHVIEVTEETLSKGGTSNIRSEGESFGAMAEITNALAKVGKKPKFIDANAYAGDNQTGSGVGKDA